ncbi:Peroxisomal fatty acid beta-oxidation multifunctional AIM1 -like protein [Gossypium arboreum]|uniref:Peroxisomal fatty acid beta-oxidation multifunctional AIM1-like protein n=1 Tax=Gossypium arboreum TaxID=29729 RepID=A0A0B0MIT6_GOSAR|nr:Peroxisomal fatty acid beta-oxidation multifunctional AIM1 -like protein [Gossypium arboreum]
MSQIRVMMEVGDDSVAVITIFNPPLNTMAVSIIAGLMEKFDEVSRRNDVKAAVLTGSGGKFCGGLDLNVIQKVHLTGDVSLVPQASVDLALTAIEGFFLSF